ncbi:peptidylprolyl isomerase [Ornithinimicrobium sp. Y1694]|uniref:peptidylprolyl isomerase n=1 Tax=Ornithinimicrobium sp. Y1694 TaxID=3418590 RepID=UPI003CFA05F6
MRPRLLLPSLAAASALTLSACGSNGSSMFGSEPTTEGGAPAGQTAGSPETGTDATGSAAEGALECEEPPKPPSQPQSFTQDDLPDPKSGDPATLTATVETNCGDIVLELDAANAPQTVASFEFLADEGYWDASTCHRLTTAGLFVLQCGDPTGTGRGNPGYGYGIENAPADGNYPPGSLAMARTQDPNSNGGQFFIVYEDTMLPTQGGGYSIFGQVTEGLDIVQAIAEQGVEGGGGDGAPTQPISILSIDIDG